MKHTSKIAVSLLVIIFLGCGLITLPFYLSLNHISDNELWRITTLGRTHFLTASNDLILFGSQNETNGDCICIYAADKTTGKIIWSTEKLAEPYIANYKKLKPESSRISGIFEIIGTDSKNNILFVTVNSFLYALDENHGNVIWGPIGISSYVFPESPDSKMLFIANDTGSLIALEKSSGKEFWRTETVKTNSDFYSRLFIYEQTIYLDIEFEGKNKLLAFDNQSGKVFWSITPKPKAYLPLFAENNLYMIYSSNMDDKNGEIIAIDTKTSKELWNTLFRGDYLYEPSPPRIVGNRLYVIQVFNNSNNQRVSKLVVRNVLSGKILWEFNQSYSDGEVIYYASDDIVYVGSETGNIFALNAEMGEELWKVKTQSFPTCMTIKNNLLIIDNANTYIAALNPKTGIQEWTQPIQVKSNRYFSDCFATDSSVRIYNNKLFVVDNERKLHVLNFDTGQEVWSWKDSRYPNWLLIPIYKPMPEIGLIENNAIYIFNSPRTISNGIFSLEIK